MTTFKITTAQYNAALKAVESKDLPRLPKHTKLIEMVNELQNGQAIDFGQHRIREILRRLRKDGWELSDQNSTRMRVATKGKQVAIIFNRNGAFANKNDMNRARAFYMLTGGASPAKPRKAARRKAAPKQQAELSFSI